MNRYISDTHFFHENVMRFDGRVKDNGDLFEDVLDMNKYIIDQWNSAVEDDDDVYVLGDMFYKAKKKECIDVLEQLKGRKHLLVGNHDGIIMREKELQSHFVNIEYLAEVDDVLDGNEVKIVLCHYPISYWNQKRHGSLHIYGHIHIGLEEGSIEYMRTMYPKALNAGAMINNYSPSTMEELIVNNGRYLNVKKEEQRGM